MAKESVVKQCRGTFAWGTVSGYHGDATSSTTIPLLQVINQDQSYHSVEKSIIMCLLVRRN